MSKTMMLRQTACQALFASPRQVLLRTLSLLGAAACALVVFEAKIRKQVDFAAFWSQDEVMA